MAEPPHCDFCNDIDPHWKYPCRDFVAAGIILDKTGKHVVEPMQELLDSTDDWYACDACSFHVEAQAWIALSLRIYPKREQHQIRAACIVLWRSFSEYRIGDKEPLNH